MMFECSKKNCSVARLWHSIEILVYSFASISMYTHSNVFRFIFFLIERDTTVERCLNKKFIDFLSHRIRTVRGFFFQYCDDWLRHSGKIIQFVWWLLLCVVIAEARNAVVHASARVI